MSSLNLSFINIDKFSNYYRLINVTSYVLRFINNLKQKKKEDQLLVNNVTADEFKKAEKLLVIFTQRDIVKQGKQLKKELNLQVEDEIFRCKGRLKNAPLSYDARFPILLPKNNAFSDLIIKLCHQNVLHNGMKETINELRNRFG